MQPKLSHTPTCDVFQIEKVNPLPVGSTTVFIDSAASSHMVSADSRFSQHVVETSDCNVRIKGSCGTSSAMKEGTLKFGICNAQNKISPVALEVLLVTCDLPSTPPVLRHGTNYVPISTKVPRMYVVNIILDDVKLDGSAKIFRTKVDAHMWHRRMGNCTLSNSWQTKTIRASSSTGTSSQATARCTLSRTVRKAATPHLIASAPRHGLKSCTRTCGGSIPYNRTVVVRVR